MNPSEVQGSNFNMFMNRIRFQRGLAFGVIIIAALLAFEIFNYSTTDYALADLLGNLQFLGVRWSTILALAFCGIDFAGIARLFTPEEGADEPGEVWYLFGAWLLAATMNAMLTWWGVSLAVLNHQTLGNAVIERNMLLRVVPIFVAVLVWLIRVLIIGTFSVAGDRLFTQSDRRIMTPQRAYRPSVEQNVPARSFSRPPAQRPAVGAGPVFRPAPKPAITQGQQEPTYEPTFASRPEPTYHPLSMSPGGNSGQRPSGNGSSRAVPPTRR